MATTTVATVERSELRLSEVARHVVIPSGIVDTLWFEIEQQCREFGVVFDVWQDGLGQVTFGLRDDGLYAATVGGITLSIPRQVAKTFFVSRAIFALCVLFPNLTVLWTAHRTRTATQTFQKLQGFAKRKRVAPHLAPGRNDGIRTTNGEQEIRFRNGSVIMFGAREDGFGRGFDEVDVEVFDEAQILTEKALEDMVAATNQSRFPHGALLFYMGTPPRPVDGSKGDVFKARRKKALAVKPEGVVVAEQGEALYVECSADPDVGMPGGPDLYDVAQIEKANASYPHRTPPASVDRLRENLPSDEAWRREGLGVWDDETDTTTRLDPGKWDDARDRESEIVGPLAFGLAMSPDKSTVAVAAVGQRPDGRYHVEVVRAERKSTWLFLPDDAGSPWLAALADRHLPLATVVDPASAAGSLLPDIEAAMVDVHVVTVGELSHACGRLYDLLEGDRLRHLGQGPLDAAVRESKAHVLARGGWIWRPSGDRHIAELNAVTLALAGFDDNAETDYDVMDSLG
ncbi:hypothetical protein [Isoptericola aurantiacus]|uniref:hypothetical protein n=1 Tax=Isoptericola aurantiacus TaxID=3377839 RepID=UPI00383ACE17